MEFKWHNLIPNLSRQDSRIALNDYPKYSRADDKYKGLQSMVFNSGAGPRASQDQDKSMLTVPVHFGTVRSRWY